MHNVSLGHVAVEYAMSRTLIAVHSSLAEYRQWVMHCAPQLRDIIQVRCTEQCCTLLCTIPSRCANAIYSNLAMSVAARTLTL